MLKYLKQKFQILYTAYKELAIDMDKELKAIKEHYDKLEREVQKLIKILLNYESDRNAVKDLTWRYNIIYHEMKRAKLVIKHESRRVVF